MADHCVYRVEENMQLSLPPATQNVGPYQHEPEWQEREHRVAAPVAEGEDGDDTEERIGNTNG